MNALPNTETRSSGASRHMREPYRVLTAAILLMHAALLGWLAWKDSPTWDEVGHLGAGLSHWSTGRFGLYRVNPPLVRIVACGPVWCLLRPQYAPEASAATRDPLDRPEFNAGRMVISANGERSFWMMTVARWSCVPLVVLGAGTCARWARELYGPLAGLFALLLWAFCPALLGYGHLITPDAGATAMGIVAAFTFWRWVRSPTWFWAITVGIALGLVELTKTTWIILFAIWPALWLEYRSLGPGGASRKTLLPEFRQLLLMIVLAIWIINLGYGFEASFKPLGDYRFISRTMTGVSHDDARRVGNRFAGTWLGRLPVPLPENYLSGIDVQKADFELSVIT